MLGVGPGGTSGNLAATAGSPSASIKLSTGFSAAGTTGPPPRAVECEPRADAPSKSDRRASRSGMTWARNAAPPTCQSSHQAHQQTRRMPRGACPQDARRRAWQLHLDGDVLHTDRQQGFAEFGDVHGRECSNIGTAPAWRRWGATCRWAWGFRDDAANPAEDNSRPMKRDGKYLGKGACAWTIASTRGCDSPGNTAWKLGETITGHSASVIRCVALRAARSMSVMLATELRLRERCLAEQECSL